jgi:Protein of unknown function (DUF1573)
MREPQTLVVGRDSASPTSEKRLLWRRCLPGICGVVFVAAGCVLWAIATFGSLHHALQYARGARVVLEPDVFTVPAGSPGETRVAVFRAQNLAAIPVSILGATVSCGCLTTDNLPVVIVPRSAMELHVEIRLPESPGAANKQIQTVIYHTDHPSVPAFAAKVAVKTTARG